MRQESSAAACFSLSFRYSTGKTTTVVYASDIEKYTNADFAMDTVVSETLYTSGEDINTQIGEKLREMETTLLSWTEENSQISQLNNAEGKTMEVSDDLAADLLAEAHELRVDLCDVVEVDIRYLDLDLRALADALQDIEPAAAARALEHIRRIRDVLEFLEHEDRYEQRPLDKARIADIGDAAIDDDTRVEQLVALYSAFGATACSLCRRLRSACAHLLHLRESFMKRGTKSKSPVSSWRFLIVMVMPR